MFDHLDEFFENFASIVLPTYSFISLLKYLLKFKAFKLKKQTKKPELCKYCMLLDFKFIFSSPPSLIIIWIFLEDIL